MQSRRELTTFLAWSMALSALGIDLMLPAFGDMRADFGLPADSTDVSRLLTAYFLGLAIGQLIYGPVADRFGRKATFYAGYLLYGASALACALAPSLGVLVVGRFVWGIGAAGPRVAAQAVIRDKYEGDDMARAMSFVMAVFLTVPVIAPTIGDVISEAGSWRWIFGVCFLAAGALSLWVVRLPETLDPRNRLHLSPRRIATAARGVVSHRQTLAYALAMTALYGGLTGFIGSAEVIVSETFNHEESFPALFAIFGVVMGSAMLFNAKVVSRFTARRVVHGVLFAYMANAAVFVLVAYSTDGRPPLWAFMVQLCTVGICQSLLIPNATSIAMLPMAAMAGTAASVIGACQIAGGAVLGALTDSRFDGTVRPLALGFLVYGAVAFVLVLWGEGWRLFGAAQGVEDIDDTGLLTIEV